MNRDTIGLSLRWLGALLAALLVSTGLLFVAIWVGNLLDKKLFPECFRRASTADFLLCNDSWYEWFTSSYRAFGLCLLAAAFTVTAVVFAPSRKRFVAVLSASLVVAVIGISYRQGALALPVVSTAVGGAAVVFWALRKYPSARVA